MEYNRLFESHEELTRTSFRYRELYDKLKKGVALGQLQNAAQSAAESADSNLHIPPRAAEALVGPVTSQVHHRGFERGDQPYMGFQPGNRVDTGGTNKAGFAGPLEPRAMGPPGMKPSGPQGEAFLGFWRFWATDTRGLAAFSPTMPVHRQRGDVPRDGVPPGFRQRMRSPASSHSQERVQVRPTSQPRNMGSASLAPPASVGLSAGIKTSRAAGGAYRGSFGASPPIPYGKTLRRVGALNCCY